MSRGNLALNLPEGAPFAPDERKALGTILGRASGEQRAWLAGYLAGIAAREAPRAEPLAPPRATEPLLILYATESGNAEGLAAKLATTARRQGFKVTLKDVADSSPAEAAAAKNLLLLAATWGEGEPPSRAVGFYRDLMAEGAPRFEKVRFSVLGLGDRAYANFCNIGREIDVRIEALGGTRVAERVECDVDFAKPAAAWVETALQALKPAEPAGAGAEIIHLDFAHPGPAEPEWSRETPFAAEVLDSVNLNSSRSDKTTVHLGLSLEGSGISFEPGDALMLVPENDPAVVGSLLTAAGLRGEDALAERLRKELDVTTLSRATIEAYQRLRPRPELADLLAGDGWRGFVEGRQAVDLLEAFPAKLEPAELATLLRPLPARAYSIASSLLAYPDEAHLLVGLVDYESHGRHRQGVASSFVTQRLAKGTEVGVYLRPNRHFRLPEAGDTPIVMIGPGTGVAPFRAFVQHRRERGDKGKSWLFFGERRFTHDFLYQLEWQEAVDEGALTRMDVAFSRDQPEKVYVQHRLWEQRADLWSWLQEGAILYLCGDATGMAKDVEAALRRIAVDQGGMTDDKAAAWLEELTRERRFRKDVY